MVYICSYRICPQGQMACPQGQMHHFPYQSDRFAHLGKWNCPGRTSMSGHSDHRWNCPLWWAPRWLAFRALFGSASRSDKGTVHQRPRSSCRSNTARREGSGDWLGSSRSRRWCFERWRLRSDPHVQRFRDQSYGGSWLAPEIRTNVRILYRFCTRNRPFQPISAWRLTGLFAGFRTKPCK